MQIFIEQGGEPLGPYSVEEATALLGNGTFSRKDVAWVQGAPRRTLGDLVGNFSQRTVTAPIAKPKKEVSMEAAVARGIIRAILILLIASLFIWIVIVMIGEAQR